MIRLVAKFAFLATLTAAMLCGAACSGTGDTSITQGPVATNADSATANGSFTNGRGRKCEMKVTVAINYPAHYSNDTLTDKLQRLFIEEVVGLPHDIDVKNAAQELANNVISQNTPQQSDIEAARADTTDNQDFEELKKLYSHITYSVQYNNNHVLSYCREERIERNGKPSSVTHRYVNIDLNTMSRMGLLNLFRPGDLDTLRQTLHDKLLELNDCDNDDEINDLGFFNLPNLRVTSNFYFTQRGVAWCYEPGSLAVESAGEPCVELSFSDLKELCSLDDSVLNRF